MNVKTASHFYQAVMRLYQVAPPPSQFCAKLALALGLIGFLISLLWTGIYLRDLRFLRNRLRPRGSVNPVRKAPPGRGPLATALAGIHKQQGIATTLSPDAMSEFINSRLISFVETLHTIARFMSYTPLLIGLAGTILGLAELLGRLNIQQSNPPALEAFSVIGALEGVFAGTLFGIGGSLLALIGGLILMIVSDRVNSKAESYVHDFILPDIPEQHIALDIEEAVLKRITTQTNLALRAFANSLESLTTRLSDTAVEATNAAATASDTFRIVAQAVENAGSLEKAAKHLVKGISNLGDAAERFERISSHIQETERSRGSLQLEINSSLARALKVVEFLSRTSEAILRQVGDQIQSLHELAGKFQGASNDLAEQISGIDSSFSGLASSVERRNQIETAKIQELQQLIRDHTEALREFSVGSSTMKEELIAFRQIMEDFTQKAIASIGKEVETGVTRLCKELEGTLEQIRQPIPEAAAQLRVAGHQLRDDVAQARFELPEIIRQLSGVNEALVKLASSMQQLANVKPPSPLPGKVEFSPESIEIFAKFTEKYISKLQDIEGLLRVQSTPKKTRFFRLFRR